MLKLLLGDPNTRKLKRYQPLVEEINLLEAEVIKLTDEQLNLKSIEQLKSLEKSQNSQGTPTSQVTIVENSNMNKSMSLMRPPLLRKQANEVKRNSYSYFLCNFLKTLCHNYLGRLVVYLLWNIYVALTSSIQKYY